jgi:magnesium-transporting ATPase (P-type)
MTESDLDMYAAVPYDAPNNQVAFYKRRDQFVQMDDPMLFVMAACHSLTFINNQLCGDPMELKMFNALGWYLGEPPIMSNQDGVGMHMPFSTVVQDNQEMPTIEVGIVRTLPFIAQLQCMSTVIIVRKSRNTTNEGKLMALTKGAPEKIASISKPETGKKAFSKFLAILNVKVKITIIAYKRLLKH